ncbi:unnamed protein product [Rhodiola kirilowii]
MGLESHSQSLQAWGVSVWKKMSIAIGPLAMSLSAAFLGCLVLLWSYKIINWVWLKPKRLEKRLRQLGFRGNPYRILQGDIKEKYLMIVEATSKPIQLSDNIITRIHPDFLRCIQTYGKNCIMWLGPEPEVYVMDPELLKEVFNRIYDFQKPPPDYLGKLLVKGLATYEGEKWVKHRKLANPAFHMEKLKNMIPKFYHSANEMVSKWETLTLASADGSCELDVWQDLQNMTRDVISRTAFGSSFEEGKRIFDLQRELTELVIQSKMSAYIAGWRFVPTKMNRRMKALDKEIKASLWVIIKKKEEAMREGNAATDDLLGLLIESNLNAMKEHKSKKDVGMSLNDVIEECKLFYFAGQETTSVLLVWTMVLLSQHQEWQKRARDEVLQVFGTEKPNLSEVNNLKIVNMILHEVLRFYPPVTMLIRATHKETVLGTMTLPAGVVVTIPVIAIHRDPQLWGEDANEFKPDRFAEGVSNATKGQPIFMPFSQGPRTCIGLNFALMEAKIAMALILQRFAFELSPSYTHAPYSLVTLHPQHGAHVILHKL